MTRNLKVKIKGTNRTRTILNYFKNVQAHKEYLISKALSTDEGRIMLVETMNSCIFKFRKE